MLARSLASCLLRVVRLWSPGLVREVCAPAQEAWAAGSLGGAPSRAQQVGAEYFAWSAQVREGTCVLLPVLHDSSTRIRRVFPLANFRGAGRAKGKNV